MKVKIYNQSGQETGEMELPKVFELPWNADLVHQVVTSQMANRRAPIAHAQDRGEVRGGGRKPWRQKGTGRARHGSIRSPLWRGGGVTHGPTQERNFKKKINKKMAARALAAVISAKIRDKEVLVVDALVLARPKTKEGSKMFQNFSKIEGLSDIIAKKPRILVLLPEAMADIRRALSNLPYVELEEARNVTALDLLNRKYLIAPQASLNVLAQRLALSP